MELAFLLVNHPNRLHKFRAFGPRVGYELLYFLLLVFTADEQHIVELSPR